MHQNGLYKLNDSGIKFLRKNQAQIALHDQESKLKSRPMFFALSCKEDKRIVYLLPITTANNQNTIIINQKMQSKGFEKNFYEKINILGKQRFLKISSVFAVSEYMISEWTSNGKIYIVQNKVVIQNVNRKLNVVLAHYKAHPERSENKVIQCIDGLIQNFNNQNKVTISI